MTTPRRTTRIPSLWALLVLFALLASACGSGLVQTPAEQAAAASSGPATAVPAQDTPEGGHQYGVSLAEYGALQTDGSGGGESTPLDPNSVAIEWPDLIPVGFSGQDIFDRFKDELAEVEQGSPEAAELYDKISAEFDTAAVNTDLADQQVRLAGFVAPLTYDGDVVTEFLLVPTFGACIHVPPPPPNQTVLVSVDKSQGLEPNEVWGAIWVEGTMTIETSNTDLAEASYTITDATSGVYDDF